MKKYIISIILVFLIGIAGICYQLDRGQSEGTAVFQEENKLNVEKSPQGTVNHTEEISKDGSRIENIAAEDDDKAEMNGITKDYSNGDASRTIYVHICGAVKKPGVYPVTGTARVADLIKAAGGLTKQAADNSVNQARLLEDGEQIYIPTKKEWETSGQVIAGRQETAGQEGETEVSQTGQGLVNINTADKETLMTLAGIGESKAESIISYREENGDFQTIEDLKKITGIKDGVFEKIRQHITI